DVLSPSRRRHEGAVMPQREGWMIRIDLDLETSRYERRYDVSRRDLTLELFGIARHEQGTDSQPRLGAGKEPRVAKRGVVPVKHDQRLLDHRPSTAVTPAWTGV